MTPYLAVPALALACVMVAGAPPARAQPAPFLAEAGFGVVGGAKAGFAVRFMVRRDFTTALNRTELVSEVYRCSFSTQACDLVAQQVDALPDGTFVSRADQSATLRTRWAGKPLVLEWRRGGWDRGATTGHSFTFQATNHVEEMLEYRATWSRATARALLGGGRDCSSAIATTMTAVAGLAEDALIVANDLPRAEQVAGLAASRGRCYRTAQ